eukprot:748127-Hanusia_phi.AAC.1
MSMVSEDSTSNVIVLPVSYTTCGVSWQAGALSCTVLTKICILVEAAVNVSQSNKQPDEGA